MMYIDTMDPTRLVKIESSERGRGRVRVYFRNLKNLRQDPEFAGLAEIPLSLFSDHPNNRFIGFVPWNREAELEKQRQIEALQQRVQYQDYEDDYDDDYND